jgi:hypothetical protein
MNRQQDLQVKLRERLRRLLTSDAASIEAGARLVRDFIEGDPLSSALLAEAAEREPDLDISAWVASIKAGDRHAPRTYKTEEGHATLAWALLRAIANDEVNAGAYWHVSGHKDLNDAVRATVETYVTPLFDFLDERVGDQSSVLYSFERYVRMIEWFDRDRLYAEFEADTAQGEDVYDRHLRRFLFREGIDMPFSQAESASGLSDAVSNLNSDDPLICEIKLFDGKGRGKAHIASGVHQVQQYAVDFSKTVAYLVIVNISGQPLNLPTDGDEKVWPPYVDLGGIRVYLLPVRALRVASASKLGKAKATRITRDDLMNPDVE